MLGFHEAQSQLLVSLRRFQPPHHCVVTRLLLRLAGVLLLCQIIPGSSITDRRAPNAAIAVQSSEFDHSGVNFRPQPSYEVKKKAQLLKDEVESVVELKDDDDSDDE